MFSKTAFRAVPNAFDKATLLNKGAKGYPLRHRWITSFCIASFNSNCKNDENEVSFHVVGIKQRSRTMDHRDHRDDRDHLCQWQQLFDHVLPITGPESGLNHIESSGNHRVVSFTRACWLFHFEANPGVGTDSSLIFTTVAYHIHIIYISECTIYVSPKGPKKNRIGSASPIQWSNLVVNGHLSMPWPLWKIGTRTATATCCTRHKSSQASAKSLSSGKTGNFCGNNNNSQISPKLLVLSHATISRSWL